MTVESTLRNALFEIQLYFEEHLVMVMRKSFQNFQFGSFRFQAEEIPSDELIHSQDDRVCRPVYTEIPLELRHHVCLCLGSGYNSVRSAEWNQPTNVNTLQLVFQIFKSIRLQRTTLKNILPY